MISRILSKFLLLLFLLTVMFYKTVNARCGSSEWTPYKEEKCIRVLDLLSNHSDAELTCQEQNSTLLSITSIEEQQFLSTLIFSKLRMFDNIWLGAVRVNSTTFRWTDGSPWTFDNWKEGSPSNVEGNNCVQMVPLRGRRSDLTFDPSPSDLWSDVACRRRNLVVCQRRPTLTLDQLTALYFQQRQASEAVIADLQRNPVPVGFVYTQLPGQPEPEVIWPMIKWTQVTQEYAGLFFRAEGGNSMAFGQVQDGESPRLSRVVYSHTTDGILNPRDITVPGRGASERIYTGSDSLYPGTRQQYWKFFLSFHNSGGEVRPKNQAIRLWKRTA